MISKQVTVALNEFLHKYVADILKVASSTRGPDFPGSSIAELQIDSAAVWWDCRMLQYTKNTRMSVRKSSAVS